MALAAIVIVLRVINRNGDRIQDYIDALTDLRIAVIELKVTQQDPTAVAEATQRLVEAKRVQAFVGNTVFVMEEYGIVATMLCGCNGQILSEGVTTSATAVFCEAAELHAIALEELCCE